MAVTSLNHLWTIFLRGIPNLKPEPIFTIVWDSDSNSRVEAIREFEMELTQAAEEKTTKTPRTQQDITCKVRLEEEINAILTIHSTCRNLLNLKIILKLS